MRIRAAALAFALVVLITPAAGCGGGTSDHTISGSAVIVPRPSAGATGCTARALGYPDVVAGAAITIKSDTGALIGTGHLGAPHWLNRACRLPFSIAHVPNTKSYSFEVAREGAQTFTRSYVAAQHFRLDLVFLPTPR